MSQQQQIITDYQRSKNKKLIVAVCLIILIIIAAIWSILSGAVKISCADITAVLLGQGTPKHQAIIWNIRLPRVITALIAGSGLALAGAVMQSILRNPLGSPYTLGISHAAAFGAAFSIIVLGTGSVQSNSADAVLLNNPYLTSGAAFSCALIATLVIVAVAKYKNAAAETMILTGVALGSLFTAGTTALQYFA
ncbi:MAG: FecCD family ABC transporter permease, partial [Bacillota bacterium]